MLKHLTYFYTMQIVIAILFFLGGVAVLRYAGQQLIVFLAFLLTPFLAFWHLLTGKAPQKINMLIIGVAGLLVWGAVLLMILLSKG
jgi:hypothetical protein